LPNRSVAPNSGAIWHVFRDVIVNQIDDLEVKYQDHPKTPYVKRAKKGAKKTTKKAAKKAPKKAPKKKAAKKKTTARGKPLPLSPELAAVVGAKELTRPEVIKKIWDYIKSNDLQDPKNKRLIVPDKKLEKIFGSSKPIDMMKLAGILSKHINV